MKKWVIFFKEDKIRLTTIEKSLEFNFGRRSIKKLIKDFIERASELDVREAESYFIVVKKKGKMAILRLPKEALIRYIEATKSTISWDDLVDAISIKAFLNSNKDLEDQGAIVKEMRTKSF